MPFPCYFKNAGTQKTFILTKGVSTGFVGEEIKATQSTWNPFVTKEWGAVDWQVSGTTFDLHTIQSHPEQGTGLGSLLMYLAAKEALAANCQTINVLLAAQSARPFYMQMGYRLDLTPLATLNQANYSASDWQKMTESCPVVGDPAAVLLAASQSVAGRWVH